MSSAASRTFFCKFQLFYSSLKEEKFVFNAATLDRPRYERNIPPSWVVNAMYCTSTSIASKYVAVILVVLDWSLHNNRFDVVAHVVVGDDTFIWSVTIYTVTFEPDKKCSPTRHAASINGGEDQRDQDKNQWKLHFGLNSAKKCLFLN